MPIYKARLHPTRYGMRPKVHLIDVLPSNTAQLLVESGLFKWEELHLGHPSRALCGDYLTGGGWWEVDSSHTTKVECEQCLNLNNDT
jgi:hypothetical protein